VAGVTGTKAAPEAQVKAALACIRAATALPCAVGFGIRTPAQAAAIAAVADGVVVGSAIVSHIAEMAGRPKAEMAAAVAELCRALADSTHAARHDKVHA
jgi:tryptophan synthase alpha chain